MTRTEYVTKLREIADFCEAHPELDDQWFEAKGGSEYYSLMHDNKDLLAAVARSCGKAEKWFNRYYAGFQVKLHSCSLIFFLDREAVCTKRVVGIEHVKAQPAFDREIVEWDCSEPWLKETPNGT